METVHVANIINWNLTSDFYPNCGNMTTVLKIMDRRCHEVGVRLAANLFMVFNPMILTWFTPLMVEQFRGYFLLYGVNFMLEWSARQSGSYVLSTMIDSCNFSPFFEQKSSILEASFNPYHLFRKHVSCERSSCRKRSVILFQPWESLEWF